MPEKKGKKKRGLFPKPRPVPKELAHLYEGEKDPLYQPNPPKGELPW